MVAGGSIGDFSGRRVHTCQEYGYHRHADSEHGCCKAISAVNCFGASIVLAFTFVLKACDLLKQLKVL